MEEPKLIKIASQIEIRTEIEKFFTDSRTQKLLTYGIIRLKEKFKINYDKDRGYHGLFLNDVIHDLVGSFLSVEGRNWNKTRFPNFKDQFYSAYDSAIANWVKKEVKRTYRHEPLEEDTENYAFLPDFKDDYEEKLALVQKTLIDHGLTHREVEILEPYFIFGMRREDVARIMKVPVNTITNWQKKIKRKLLKMTFLVKV